MFVELVDTNPLMYNLKDLGSKQTPSIRLKIVVQTDRQIGGIDFKMYSERIFEW